MSAFANFMYFHIQLPEKQPDMTVKSIITGLRKTVLTAFLLAPFTLFSQAKTAVDKMGFFVGASVEKNFVDLNSVELGVNVFATRGRLVTDEINYFGFETSYKWIALESQNQRGIALKGIYQWSKNPIGFNTHASVLFGRNSTFLLPEAGLNLYGFLSLNYGYYFRLNASGYDPTCHSITLRLNLNICYLAYMSLVGKSEKKRLFK